MVIYCEKPKYQDFSKYCRYYMDICKVSHFKLECQIEGPKNAAL